MESSISLREGGRFRRPLEETLGAGHVVWYSAQGLRATADRLGLYVMDSRGSRNQTAILTERFAALPRFKRLPSKAITIVLNRLGAPLGHPNHILAALLPFDGPRT